MFTFILAFAANSFCLWLAYKYGYDNGMNQGAVYGYKLGSYDIMESLDQLKVIDRNQVSHSIQRSLLGGDFVYRQPPDVSIPHEEVIKIKAVKG